MGELHLADKPLRHTDPATAVVVILVVAMMPVPVLPPGPAVRRPQRRKRSGNAVTPTRSERCAGSTLYKKSARRILGGTGVCDTLASRLMSGFSPCRRRDLECSEI